MSGYTVVDLETTGLFPGKHDRIVEIALVKVADDGAVQDEWTTLVNPGRDVGPTRIHGITAADVLDAPTFAEISDQVVAWMIGRTMVAHNARFDAAFLDAEFSRAGTPTTPPTPALCTMQWSPRYVRGASRKLVDCCSAAGVAHLSQHTAAGDARAVAALLARLLQLAGSPVPWHADNEHTRGHPWPARAGSASVNPCVRGSGNHRPGVWLDRVTSDLPRNPDPVIDSYLEVLERALLDRYLSRHEEAELVEVASSLGLQRDQMTALHATYLDALALAAWDDGVVTASEAEELRSVATMLGLPVRLAQVALDRAATLLDRSRPTTFQLTAGDRVCLTGEMSMPREQCEALAAEAGLVVGGLTKRTAVLVAADPDSQSGKAAKARGYGVPIITEAAFTRLLRPLLVPA